MSPSDSTGKPPITPSGPLPDPCLSFWQRTTRSYSHLHANQETPLPATAKYVVVGSGISGALTAFSLLENGISGSDIIILEAREAASGASSRNAGHVRPDAFRGFNYYSSLHGPDQALKIISNERVVLAAVDSFVKTHNVSCDFNPTSTFDVCMTPTFAAYEKESLDAFVAAGGDVSHVKFYEGEEAQLRTGVKDAVAAYEWPAGSSHPARLAHWLLSAVIEKGGKLFTFCPVEKVIKSETEKIKWEIVTSRGTVTTENVIHCTNAYASLLLPQLSTALTPNRAQAHSLIAPTGFSGTKGLRNTFSLRYSLRHFYSLIQRKSDGVLILGVSRTNPELSADALESVVSFDDGEWNEEILQDALKRWDVLFPEKVMSLGTVKNAGLECAWTGIIGMTGDSVPFVGKVEGLEGQWICAGFGGHGMARIFTCAPGLAKLVVGKEWKETGLPECFELTKERIAKMAGQKASQPS